MVVAVIIGIFVAIAMPVFLNARYNTTVNTCKKNLRLIDGAIQTYGADNQGSPSNLAALVPKYLKEIPKEPLGGVYLFVAATSAATAYAACSQGHSY